MGRGISAGTMGIVILAILAGLVGAYIIRASLIKPEVVAAKPGMISIPLAAVDLPEGRTVALGDVALTNMTYAETQERGYDLTKTMTDPQQIIGRILHEDLKQGKPFRTDAFYLQGTRYDYTKDLKPGFRALTMQIPKDRFGSLPVGSTVDIMFRATERRPVSGLQIPEVTVRLLEGVKILDVFEPPPPPARTGQGIDLRQVNQVRTPPPLAVTFAVTPEQAAVIQTASGRGEMTPVARPMDERLAASTGKRKGLTLEDVLGIEPPPPVVLFATELYRRSARSVNVFRDDKLVEQIKAQQEEKAAQPPPPPAPAPGTGVVPPPTPQAVPVPVPVPVVPGLPGAAVPVPVPVPVPVVP